jgi:hypothetical protein
MKMHNILSKNPLGSGGVGHLRKAGRKIPCFSTDNANRKNAVSPDGKVEVIHSSFNNTKIGIIKMSEAWIFNDLETEYKTYYNNLPDDSVYEFTPHSTFGHSIITIQGNITRFIQHRIDEHLNYIETIIIEPFLIENNKSSFRIIGHSLGAAAPADDATCPIIRTPTCPRTAASGGYTLLMNMSCASGGDIPGAVFASPSVEECCSQCTNYKPTNPYYKCNSFTYVNGMCTLLYGQGQWTTSSLCGGFCGVMN